MSEQSKILDFRSELELAQVQILSVTEALFISTFDLLLYRRAPLFCLIRSSHRPAHTDYYSIKTKHNKALTEISSKHYKHTIGRSRRNRPVSHGNFDKDEREAIVSIPRRMLVKYTAGNDCQHQKSSTIFNNKKYTEENSV
ncbi:hypothetical protein J6590_067493 [Homalodisca vitripennis]|nr:hypothetical protein J6590_067493 [Homalodisca vitripennis]